ncbi:hypothetical protein HBB16_01440 [Pseudonocardia sp. MCCB 268]|nr:hypothetical protein [Pseudonocardia cytotoxica]
MRGDDDRRPAPSQDGRDEDDARWTCTPCAPDYSGRRRRLDARQSSPHGSTNADLARPPTRGGPIGADRRAGPRPRRLGSDLDCPQRRARSRCRYSAESDPSGPAGPAADARRRRRGRHGRLASPDLPVARSVVRPARGLIPLGKAATACPRRDDRGLRRRSAWYWGSG